MKLSWWCALLGFGLASPAFADCTTNTDRTYTSSVSTAWNTAANWSGTNIPDTATENAIIVSTGQTVRIDNSYTVGCFEAQSGAFTSRGNFTLTVKGDYFRNLTPGTMTCRAADTFVIDMNGTAPQTFENEDACNDMVIHNNTSVTFTNPFSLIGNITFFAGNTGTLKIKDNVTINTTSTTSVFTIPAGATVEVSDGAIFTSMSGIAVSGTLTIKAGSQIVIPNGKSLVVNAGGVINFQGASANVATLTSNGAANTFTFTMNGNLNASYFRIEHTTTVGMNVGSGGVVQALDYGEFHYIANNGYAITIPAGSSMPANLTDLGFYNDAAVATPKNINATGYNSTAVAIANWNGSVGGASFETDAGNKITWGSQGGTKLNLTNATASGIPSATTAQNTTKQVLTYAFALSKADIATNVTSITFTQIANGASSDIASAILYKDAAASKNCLYNAGTDTQIGSTFYFTGDPAVGTVNLSAGDITTSSDSSIACVHLVITTTTTSFALRNLRFSVSSTSDVTNDQNYSFNGLAGPPVNAGNTRLTGSTMRIWQGDISTAWNTTTNWSGGVVPLATTDCRIGPATRNPLLNVANPVCQNVVVQNGGLIDWNNTTDKFSFKSLLDVETGVTFNNATAGPGSIAADGTSRQSIRMRSTFPGTFDVNNAGAANANVVSVDADSTFSGAITVTAGILYVPSGVTLTSLGNLTVKTGATLQLAPGAILKMGNGKTLTVDSGGTLSMIGTAPKPITVGSNVGASAFNVVVNGTIRARYYTFDHLGTAGVSIEAGATVDATNFLQNGTFSYPVNNASTLLKLKRQIPGNALSNMQFDLAGSTATGTKNIDTTGAGAGTLTITTYSGDVSGPTFNTVGLYLISWTGATNTIQVTQESVGPASVNAGSTYTMGRFGFKQATAGASFLDADITSLKLTMTGTASAASVSDARIYYDAGCTGSGGVLIDSGSFTGNPGTKTFTFTAGEATVPMNATTTVKKCLYLVVDVANDATNATTLGFQISSNSDFVNNQSYAVAASTPLPVGLGTAANIVGASLTSWLGSTSTDWFTGANWTAGVPGSGVDCTIASAARNPVVNGGTGTARCKSVNITNGTVTLTNGTSAALEVYGNYTNTGTFTQNDGTLKLRDDGVTFSDQTISSTTVISILTFGKTAAGGSVSVGGASLQVNTLTFPTPGSSFTFQVPAARILILPNGLTLSNGTFDVKGGGELRIGDAQVITVSGGTFKVSGTSEANPQTLSTKGKITVNVSGSWGFNQTSGISNFSGFQLDKINSSGLRFNGGTLQALDGGQFTDLSTSYSTMKVLQFNQTGVTSLPATSTNVGFNWGPTNPVPDPADTFLLAYSTGCSSQTITFNQWFGDFYDFTGNTPDPTTKISATSCTVTMGSASSAVSLTALTATAYDSAVSVDWVTGSETNHQGFNVYRSTNPLYGFVQINSGLIRNQLHSNSFHGTYRYTDTDVINGTPYYYLVEDVASNGMATRHGPLAALPDSGKGTVPVTAPGVSEGGSVAGANTGNGGTPSTVGNGAFVDLGNGAHLLGKSSDRFRVELKTPAESFSASGWNGAYQVLRMPGYSSFLDPGYPELLERVVLVEVKSQFSTATVLASAVDDSDLGVHNLQPAPAWATDSGGILQPTYSASGAAYAASTLSPSSWFELTPDLVEISGKKYARLRFFPIRQIPSTGATRKATRMVVDIGLQGGGVSPGIPAGLAQSPSAVDGSLRIQFRKTGMYELSFDQLAEAGLEYPFAGQPVSQFRLYWRGTEIPLQIHSGNGSFQSGDYLRFYAIYSPGLEDVSSEVVLAQTSLGDSSGAPLRMGTLSVDPMGFEASNRNDSFQRVVAEEDHFPAIERPLGTNVDRFYWKQISRDAGAAADPGASFLDFTTSLARLDPESGQNVSVKVYLRAYSVSTTNGTQSMALWLNQGAEPVATKDIPGGPPVVVTFTFPVSSFRNGANSVRLEALATHLFPGDTAILQINKIVFEYRGAITAVGGIAQVESPVRGYSLTATGFSGGATVTLYDVSEPSEVTALSDALASSSDGGVTTDVSFAPGVGASGNLGVRVLAVEEGSFLTPSSAEIVTGFSQAMKSTSRRADIILVGNELMLSEASDYIAYRQGQGMSVVTVSPAQLYAEFSHGTRSSQAIKDFVEFATTSWQAPKPKYLIFVGDATYDPNNRMNMSLGAESMPMPLEQGTFVDFGSDHWFVENAETQVPRLAVGRVPTNDPAAMKAYFAKVVAYENGTRAPTADQAKRVTLVSDRDFVHESFAAKATALGQAFKSQRPDLSLSYLDRGVVATESAMHSLIVDEFNRFPLMMTYLGHGAENMWGTGSVENSVFVSMFDTSAAGALTNTRLPLVVGLNCLNANFYEFDPSLKSLGESLILNEQGGAAAFFGFTTMTVPTAQLSVQTALQNQLAHETELADHEVRLGDVVLQVKAAVGISPHSREAVRSFSLIGDPALRLPSSLFAGASSSDVSVSGDGAQLSTPVDQAAGNGGGCGRVRRDNVGLGRAEGVSMLLLLGLFGLMSALARRAALRHRRF